MPNEELLMRCKYRPTVSICGRTTKDCLRIVYLYVDVILPHVRTMHSVDNRFEVIKYLPVEF